ncbi:MAG: hypothetical protein IPO22_12430 [Anaerolineales bacterium]|nr:hypothetical protein [Anaerolineales bacterium]
MKKNFFSAAVVLQVAGMLAYLSAIAYLGVFSRYGSDDYCETIVTTSSSPLNAVLTRYEEGGWRAAGRYSNLFFVGVSESLLGSQSVSIVPVAMIILWGLGLIHLVRQVRTLAGIEWHFLLDVFFGASLAFISILEAPSRFQILYWRSSMATHFAPLVFLNFLVAALLSRLHTKRENAAPVWFALVLLVASFIIGGFSEPPVAVMVVGSGLALAYIWFFVKDASRRSLLILTGCVLVGALSSLAVMALSPAASNLGADTPSFAVVVQRTLEYTVFFQIDSFKTLPLPVIFSFVCPAILVFAAYCSLDNAANPRANWKIALALPFILFILIAAGFSTSAYGQSYPVMRARFFAHFFMTITLVLEGALFGIWLSSLKGKFLNTVMVEYASVLVLLVMAVYPFRAFLQVLQDVPEYSARAQAWDRRDAHIYKLRDLGQTDLLVPQFDGSYDVKELDTYPEHWVNRCASTYYGVNSIRAIPIHGADALEEYYNYFGGYDQ